MRLGGPLQQPYHSPEDWVAAVQALGYRAVYCPVSPDADDATVRAYRAAAHTADLVIAEVGAWSNPLSEDAATRAAALTKCKQHLLLAERIGARCCVNIAGSRGAKWDGPDPRDLSEDTFALIVDTVREIIDDVQPQQTYYALETMPWMYPDSPDSYLRLITAIDRPRFAAHLDPVNMINCPQRFFENAAFMRECVAKLGPYIRSCHIKDIAFGQQMVTHLDEVRPGLGSLDYPALLQAVAALDDNMPLMLEHLPNQEEYALAATYVRGVARECGMTV